MAAFDWMTMTIDMGVGGTSFSSKDLSEMPASGPPTMSFVHEYIHYVQSLSSVAAGRWLSELLQIAVLTALLLDGHVPERRDETKTSFTPPGFLPIIPILKKHPRGAAKALRIQQRFQPLYQQGSSVFSLDSVAGPGAGRSYEIIEMLVGARPFWGTSLQVADSSRSTSRLSPRTWHEGSISA